MIERALVAAAMVAALVAASGCSTDEPAAEACEPDGAVIGGPASGPIGDIDYRSSGGFTGQGSGLSVHVGPGGSGTRETRGQGSEPFQLDTAALRALVAKVEAAHMSTLCPVYSSEVADDFTDVVTVEIAGSTLMVVASESAPLPARLEALIEAIKQLP